MGAMGATRHPETGYCDTEVGDVEVSVIVPVYRGRRFIEELSRRLVATLETISPKFEILLVDDRDPDEVWPLIVELGNRDARIKGMRLSRNFGQHPALTAGIDHARGRWLVVMDCDLQDAPEDIPALYRKAVADQLDIVVALRREHHVGRRRRLSSWVFNWMLAKLGDVDTRSEIGNFRIFSRQVALAFQLHREQFRLLPALMARLGFNVGYVEVDRPGRPEGRSSYSYRKLFGLAIDAIVANSEKPLWLGIYLGLSIAAIAFALAVWALTQKLFADVGMDGWTSLFIAVTFFSGVQLVFAGIIGIYLGRVYHETKRRPLYLVSNTSNIDAART
jgi:dolichol-phosphate mannosyltransferase